MATGQDEWYKRHLGSLGPFLHQTSAVRVEYLQQLIIQWHQGYRTTRLNFRVDGPRVGETLVTESDSRLVKLWRTTPRYFNAGYASITTGPVKCRPQQVSLWIRLWRRNLGNHPEFVRQVHSK
jgi:hypothetical protein